MKRPSPLSTAGGLLAATLVGLLVLPLAALVLSTSAPDLQAGVGHPLFGPAVALSLRTTFVSLLITVVLGTPLAWWLRASRSRAARWVGVLVELPIVMPPAVVGVALLQTFGRQGVFGDALHTLGLAVPFTEGAVVLAQVVVSAPFYVQAAATAFREIQPDMLVVARTLGASPAAAVLRVALPVALPGLVVGASLAWARALGEFGATLIFAGNLAGTTQTVPLAIFEALQTDVRLAVVFALVLVALAAVLLVALRAAPSLLRRTR